MNNYHFDMNYQATCIACGFEIRASEKGGLSSCQHGFM